MTVSRAGVGTGHHLLLLPPDARDMTFYERLASALEANPIISLTGNTHYRPTAPTHSIDVVAFNAVLVLPTPGEVRMLQSEQPRQLDNQRAVDQVREAHPWEGGASVAVDDE